VERELVCIRCPIGCRLTVSEVGGVFSVKGNTCANGWEYGIKEVTNPVRWVTDTVVILHAKERRLPVKTSIEIPKDMVLKVASEIKKICVSAPIQSGEIIQRNILGTGADIVATMSIDKKSK